MNRQLLDENFGIFPQNSKIFLQILVAIVKSRCHFKLSLGHAVFQLLPESTFP